MNLVVDLLQRGGAVTGVVLLLGVIATVIIFERLLHYHRAQINVPEFLRGVLNVLRRGNAVEAASICVDTPGPVAHIVRAAILRGSQGEKAIRQAIDDASLSEIPRLERSLGLLATISTIGPLLGLLGTVLGMVTLFMDMESAGQYVHVETLAGGIRQALLSTAVGLTVGIGAHGFYNYFVRRVDGIVLDMEKTDSELLYFLSENPVSVEEQEARPRSEHGGPPRGL